MLLRTPSTLTDPRPLSTTLRLAGETPLAVGSQRNIYSYPDADGYLIKVMRNDALGRRWGPNAPWYKRLSRTQHYISYVRELKEYIVTQARHAGVCAPLSRMLGVVETDLGLGLVAEKVRAPDGTLGPTLAHLYQGHNGFTPWIEQALDEFHRTMLECEIIVGDLHAWNIIYGSDSRGGPRFVMVDGFGEKNILPLTSMSRRYNRRRTLQRYERMRAQLQRLVPLSAASGS